MQEETHKIFTDVFGGKVFYVYSIKKGDKKEIFNKEVIQLIAYEIEQLKRSQTN